MRAICFLSCDAGRISRYRWNLAVNKWKDGFLNKWKATYFDFMQNVVEGVHASILHWDTTCSTLPKARLSSRTNYLVAAAKFRETQCCFPGGYWREGLGEAPVIVVGVLWGSGALISQDITIATALPCSHCNSSTFLINWKQPRLRLHPFLKNNYSVYSELNEDLVEAFASSLLTVAALQRRQEHITSCRQATSSLYPWEVGGFGMAGLESRPGSWDACMMDLVNESVCKNATLLY